MGDLRIINARVWRGDGSDARANCVVIRDGVYEFVGDERDVNVPSSGTTLDARGGFLMPGCTDSHAHLLNTGFALSSINLKAADSLETALGRVHDRAAQSAPGIWLRGAGWDQNDWPGAKFPDRRALDAAAPNNPCVLTHTSGHCIWVNSRALQLAGIDAATSAPRGGAIDVDFDGAPTGILRDNAMRLIGSVVPSPTPPERVSALEAAVEHAHALGVTGAHAMDVGRGEYQAMLALRDSGKLRFRLDVFLTAGRIDEWVARAVRTGDGDEIMRIGGVKFFSDGALGSLTAWMFKPYRGTDDCGFPLQPVEDLERDVRRCLENGLAPAIHAIGDRANHEVLDLYERLSAVAPEFPRRIEHAQLLTDADVLRFAQLGVTASVQPIHATQDMAKVDREWGDRGSGAYAFASLLASGARLAFGSDTPVETMDPLVGLHAAVTRRNARGDPPDGWRPSQRVLLQDAMAAYTVGPAQVVGREATLGRIAPGAHADAVLLSHDLRELDDPMAILGVHVDATLVGGEIVYERGGS
ncbi:MAG TPA: amidohydrolase [Dehalococcoidia bacterium]